jgi:ribosomal biogenesis protein LAS1
MTTQPLITVWRDWEEWELVFKGFYGTDQAARAQALELVGVWQSRGHLPLAVEATCEFLQLRHENPQRVPSASHRYSLGLALVRFVNGYADQLQTGQSARPILMLVRGLGLPERLVTLRHSTTHSIMPSWEALQEAADFAIDWMYQTYWAPTSSHLQQLRNTLAVLLERFRDVVRSKSPTHPGHQGRLAQSTQLATLLEQFEQRLDSPSLVQLCANLLASKLHSSAQKPDRVAWRCLLTSLSETYAAPLQLALFIQLCQLPPSPAAGWWVNELLQLAESRGLVADWPLSLVIPLVSATPSSPLTETLLRLGRLSVPPTVATPVHFSHPHEVTWPEDASSPNNQIRRVAHRSVPYAFSPTTLLLPLSEAPSDSGFCN